MTSNFKVGDIVRIESFAGGFRVWRVIAVCLGGEQQESVVELETLDRLPTTEGRVCVPLEMLSVLQAVDPGKTKVCKEEHNPTLADKLRNIGMDEHPGGWKHDVLLDAADLLEQIAGRTR